MIEDELVKIWQSSPNTEVIKFEKSKLMLEVQSGLDLIDKAIKIRDRNEFIGVIVVIPVFVCVAYIIPYSISKIASVMIILWAVYVLMRLKKAKKNKPGSFTATYLDYLYKTRTYLQAQRHLIDTVLWWYILPPTISGTIFFMGFLEVPGKIPAIIRGEVICVAMGLFIYIMNKWAVKTMYDPKLQKINELIQVMENNKTTN